MKHYRHYKRAALILITAALCIKVQGPGYAEKGAPGATMTNPHEMPPVKVTGVGPGKLFTDAEKLLACTFEYPENWAIGTEKGRKQPYQQVIILGPRNTSNNFSASLTMRRMPMKASGGIYSQLADLTEVRQKQYAKNPQYRQLNLGERMVSGQKAVSMTIEYTVPIPPYGKLQAEQVTLRTQFVQFALAGALYELSFSADARDYSVYEPVFERLLQTFVLTAPPPSASVN